MQEVWQDFVKACCIALTLAESAITLHAVTPTQRLAEVLLGQPLADYVADKRDDGKSWQQIASRLNHDTSGVVDVSRETLRQWYGGEVAA